MGERHTSQYRETMHPAAPRELYREKIGFQDYVITDEEPEVIKKWKIEIEQLRDAISRRDLESLDALAMGHDFKPHAEKVYKILESEGLDEEDKTLLAISLWILREQDKWTWSTLSKVLKGGTFSLSSFLQKKGQPSCLDSAVLTKRMAEGFQIEGQVKLAEPDKKQFSHRYFQSESGKIVDVWWGRRNRAGLFQKEAEYEKKKTMARHLCGFAS